MEHGSGAGGAPSLNQGTSNTFAAGRMNEQQMDDLIRSEEAGLDNLKMSKEQLLGPITDMKAYEIDKLSLECPELESNPIFIKLRTRILKFFITSEETRRYGMTQKQ